MLRKSFFSILVLAILLGPNLSSANAIFGLSACEKVRKQAQSDQSIIASLAKSQAALLKTRDAQIAKQGYLNYLSSPNAISDGEIRLRTIATFKKILSSFQNLQNNQKCLKSDKISDVFYFVESYKKGIAFWSSSKASNSTPDAISYGRLIDYLK